MTKFKHHDVADRQLDEELRRALDPEPGMAERLARRVLEGSEVAPRRVPWLRPVLVAVALLALVTMSARVIPHLVTETAPEVADRPSVLSPADDGVGVGGGADPEPTAARLSISNLDGPVTVTTADGTRWIALSSTSDSSTDSSTDASTNGDPVS